MGKHITALSFLFVSGLLFCCSGITRWSHICTSAIARKVTCPEGSTIQLTGIYIAYRSVGCPDNLKDPVKDISDCSTEYPGWERIIQDRNRVCNGSQTDPITTTLSMGQATDHLPSTSVLVDSSGTTTSVKMGSAVSDDVRKGQTTCDSNDCIGVGVGVGVCCLLVGLLVGGGSVFWFYRRRAALAAKENQQILMADLEHNLPSPPGGHPDGRDYYNINVPSREYTSVDETNVADSAEGPAESGLPSPPGGHPDGRDYYNINVPSCEYTSVDETNVADNAEGSAESGPVKIYGKLNNAEYENGPDVRFYEDVKGNN